MVSIDWLTVPSSALSTISALNAMGALLRNELDWGMFRCGLRGLSLPVENQIVKQLIVWQGAENRRAARPQSNPD
jgi:hypothetical protein